jgi:DNA-binding CsgD family transcriptional regulator/tetratricopeptide (TPR) repeat protein
LPWFDTSPICSEDLRTMATSPVSKPQLVGRQRQLQEIASRLEAVASGQGHEVLIGGEPGVGKTRFMLEAAARAEAQGWLVLSGQASDIEGTPPYLPFAEALRDHVASLAPGELAELAGRHGAEIARLLPELSERLPDLTAAMTVTPMSERFRFFEAVTALVGAIAQTQPKGLILCLDDLHLADEASLFLLEHLARRIGSDHILILAAYRDTEVDSGHRLVRTLEALARQPSAARIDLKPLDLTATRLLVASLAGSNPPAAVARALHQEMDGNPFYIGELFSALVSEGRLFDAAGRWRSDLLLGEAGLPRGMRLIISRRLSKLSADCRQALGIAAILGRHFDPVLLREVSGLAEDALLDALDEATRHHFVEEGSQRLRFCHELIRQTLLSDVSLARRQRLHLHTANAIERLAQGKTEERVAELAGHYHLAGSLADPAMVLRYANRAADKAAAALAFEEALRLYEIALVNAGALDRTPEVEETITVLHLKRAEALFSLGRWREARPDFEATLEKSTSEQRAEVLINLALASSWAPDMPAAKRYTAEAGELVEKLGLRHLDATIAALRAHCDVDDGELTKAIGGFKHSASLAGMANSGAYRRLLWLFPAILYQAAHHGEAVAVAEAAIAIARQAGDVAELANLLPSLGLALGAAGRYREADSVLAEGRRISNDYQAPGLVAISKSAGFHIETFDLAGAKAFAEEAHDPASSVQHWPFPTVSSGLDLVIIAAREGQAGAAATRLKEVARQVEGAMGRHGWLWKMRLAQARAEVALAKGDLPQAVESGSDAMQQSGAISRPKYQALALETRGKALIGLGRKRDGLKDLRQAVEVARPVGDPAMFLRAAAELLAFDGDDALVTEAYDAAGRIAAELPEEMLPGFLDAEPVRLVYKLRESPLRRPRLPAGLSARELEVLQLIAAGQSNQQIAETLVLSVRTVERHINHIYAKAGVASRTQAMAFATREGIGAEAQKL